MVDHGAAEAPAADDGLDGVRFDEVDREVEVFLHPGGFVAEAFEDAVLVRQFRRAVADEEALDALGGHHLRDVVDGGEGGVPELTAELGPELLVDLGGGGFQPVVDHAAVDGAGAVANRSGVEHGDVDACCGEGPGGVEPGDAGADDRHLGVGGETRDREVGGPWVLVGPEG